ncbi:ATP-binding protein [Streptomyces geranii]|uniref:ATP-binding protein n=1 Tax=Streptomyces geranii TaxID=2058923 RepID=UPI000D037D03|nr:ATP-binding protein [Streptomyces geranii]
MTAVQPIPVGAPGYTTSLLCKPESAGTARRLVVASLSTWGLGDLADVGRLVVSELVSNSVRHTSCRLIKVSVRRMGVDRVRIGVTDKSCRLPELGAGNSGHEGGRGLLLVEVMADRWGYDKYRWGKTVWAELVVVKDDEVTS